MEATLILFTKAKFDWGIKEVSFGFAYIGIIMIFTQGYLVRKLIPKLGEKQVLRTGLVLMTMGLSGIAIAQSIGVLALTQTLLAVGIGFVNPSILGSISLLTDPNEQGASLGTTQGMASLGRIIGPVVGGALFGALTIESPFILSGAMTMIALFVVITIFKEIPNAGLKTKKSQMLNKIGFYQLDNLINNRVPFLFFNMSESILGWYSSVNKMHLESYEILTTESEIIALLTEKKAPKDYAIVLLCPDGRISLKLNTELEKLGYTNVYVIDGGYAQLVTERE